MKILCLTPWFPNHKEDQTGNFILDSVLALVSEGHEVIVLVTRSWKPGAKKINTNDFSDKLKLYTCRYLSIPRSFMARFSYWCYRKRVNLILEKIIKRHHCQIIHAHTEVAGISAVEVGHKLGIPVVMTIHGISTDKKLYKKSNRKLLFEYTLSKANRVILVGKTLEYFLAQFVKNTDHFRIVSNGFRAHERNLFSSEKRSDKNIIHLISVSNLVEGKGIDLNICALSKLKEIGISNWKYTIVGDGDQKKKIESLIVASNLTKKIMLLGACEHHDVYNQLAKADVFILPSYREAFGVAYLEAMSFGLLAVGVKGQGPATFIEHEKTGILIEPNSVDSLFDALKKIFLSYGDNVKISEAGKKHVQKHFTLENHAKILSDVYQELLQ